MNAIARAARARRWPSVCIGSAMSAAAMRKWHGACVLIWVRSGVVWVLLEHNNPAQSAAHGPARLNTVTMMHAVASAVSTAEHARPVSIVVPKIPNHSAYR